jgi:tetratricopeptide (TPR) repeat protein
MQRCRFEEARQTVAHRSDAAHCGPPTHMASRIETDPRRDVVSPGTTTTGPELGKLIADAVMHHRAGRLAQAEAAYLAVLNVAPGHPAALHNLGVIAGTRGQPDVAIDRFDAAIAAEPNYAAAHYNRAVACHALGRIEEALLEFSRACAVDPGHYDAHRALGFLWLARGERDRAVDHFARTYELRRGEDRTEIAARSLSHATRGKLLHDAEQLQFLAARRRDGGRFAILARAYEQVATEIGPDEAALSARQLELLGEDYNKAIHISPAPACAGTAISERPDRDAILLAFETRDAGAACFDDLLTASALNRLKKYLLESTVWHDFSHIGGFVASYLEDGLASPLLLQIADELRTTFPQILGSHPLSQAWAFKGFDTNAAIQAHADDGVVSVNFWVTPDAANLRPGSGGLAVCLAPPPADWLLTGYHADESNVAAFLAQHADHMLIVPYRENRAVLFESRLFHRSDAPHFAPGYENRRINVTLLFGRHG